MKHPFVALAFAAFSLTALGTGCPDNHLGIDAGPQTTPTPDAGNPPDAGPPAPDTSTEPTEWVNFHLEIPVDAGAFDPLASSLFGAGAQSGQFVTQQAIAPSFWATSAADPTTPTQVRLTFAFDDGTSTPRVVAVAPASFAIGQIFIATVDAAIAQMQSDVASNNAGGEIFDLDYQTVSTQGGTLTLGLKGNQGAYTLVLDVTSPHTSLVPGSIGSAASNAGPYDLVSGTVNFTMSQDEFDYFVNHAYGSGATAGQNFSDFELVPYDWLRLTVTPNLPQNIVNVSFNVITPSGPIALASAPASVMAGSTFQALVDRQMTNMTAQEKVKAGSSIPWTVPFYYDQPTGGGVVQVIANGLNGVFGVAYSVASPQHPLSDVPFVPYEQVTFPPPDTNATTPCYQLGNPDITQSLHGVFQITFSISNAIMDSLTPGQQLVGDIGCSIFYASDVTVTGPNPGAQSLEDFVVKGANMLATPAPTFTTTTQITDGQYQILCAQYVDGNDNNSDMGDPVTLPIGGYTLACNVNPITVQFAILDPQSQ